MRTHGILIALFATALLAPVAASAQEERVTFSSTWVTGRGMLGFTSTPIGGEALHQRRVVEVVPESPAGRAGLAVGDTLLRINGLAASPQVMSAPFEAGDTVTLRIRRDGRERELTMVAVERPNQFRMMSPDSINERFAVTFERMRAGVDSSFWIPSISMRRIHGDSGTVVILGADTLHITSGDHARILKIDPDSILGQYHIRSLPRMLPDSAGLHLLRPGESHMYSFFKDTIFPPEMITSSVFFGMRAVAGAELAPLNPALGEYFGAADGVLVINAAARTPAERSGLRGGDVIVQAGDTPVRSITELRRAIDTAGGDVTLRVLRQGRYEDIVLRR